MGIYYFHGVPGAPLVTCPRCGSSYPMVQWVNQGCKFCKDELRQQIAHEIQRIETDFWKEHKY